MRKTKAAWLLSLLCCLCAAAGCGGGAANNSGQAQTEVDPDAVVAEVNSFTDDLVKKAESGGNLQAGVEAAQALLDSRKDGLKARIAAARASRKFREDKEANGRLLECEVAGGDRVAALYKSNLDAAMKDAALMSKFGKLRSDYNDIFK